VRIGIFGGSFNPIHNGHLKLTREALSELNLDRIYFVPSYRTPFKKKEDLLPDSLRLRLLKTALKGRPEFFISPCEMRRKGMSYTVDTLRFFRKKFGKRAQLFFLAGGDTLKNLPRWKSLKEVLKMSRFIVMTRPGYKAGRVPAGVAFVPLDALPISASDIRMRLKSGRSVRGLVPLGTERLLRSLRRPRNDT